MPNHIATAERVAKEMRQGWPNGTTHLYKVVPALLNRIAELENALAPFARNGTLPSASELVYAYHKDCVHAKDMLDSRQSVRPKEDTFFSTPAE
jgi:hypothetical protein